MVSVGFVVSTVFIYFATPQLSFVFSAFIFQLRQFDPLPVPSAPSRLGRGMGGKHKKPVGSLGPGLPPKPAPSADAAPAKAPVEQSWDSGNTPSFDSTTPEEVAETATATADAVPYPPAVNTPGTKPFAEPAEEENVEAETALSTDASVKHNNLAMESAGLRARCLSLEAVFVALRDSHQAEMATVRATAETATKEVRHELSTATAMTSAQTAKINLMTEQMEDLQRELDEERGGGERKTSDAVEKALADAVGALKQLHQKEIDLATKAHRAALELAYAESGRTEDTQKEQLRTAYLVHASDKAQWYAELIAALETKKDAVEDEINHAKRVAAYARAAVGGGGGNTFPDGQVLRETQQRSFDDFDEATPALSPSAALRALFAATTPGLRDAALSEARGEFEGERGEFESERRETAAGVTSKVFPDTAGDTVVSRGDASFDAAGSLVLQKRSESDASIESGVDGEIDDDEENVVEENETKVHEKPSLAGPVGRNLLGDLLDDAMEDEIALCIERGWCVDETDGSLVVGGSGIVERVMRKYRGAAGSSTSSSPSRNKLTPLFSERNAGVPWLGNSSPSSFLESSNETLRIGGALHRDPGAGLYRDSAEAPNGPGVFAEYTHQLEREKFRSERRVLLAELQQTRAMVDKVSLQSGVADRRIANETMETITAAYRAEERAAVHRLGLAGDKRALDLEKELQRVTRKVIPAHALNAIAAELGELRATLRRVREAQEVCARLVSPTVASALACLELSPGTPAASPGRFAGAAGASGTPGASPRGMRPGDKSPKSFPFGNGFAGTRGGYRT